MNDVGNCTFCCVKGFFFFCQVVGVLQLAIFVFALQTVGKTETFCSFMSLGAFLCILFIEAFKLIILCI